MHYLFQSIVFFSLVLLTENYTIINQLVKIKQYFFTKLSMVVGLNKDESNDFSPVLSPVDNLVDEDVQLEISNISYDISQDNMNSYSMIVSNLSKVYPASTFCGSKKHAVKSISIGLKPGERFGLLGVNGAGKSTTLNILTGDIAATSGEAYIAGILN